MFYRDLNDIRQRSNVLGVILNRATNYGRRPLPEQFADIRRELDELNHVWQNTALIKDGVEIAEAILEDITHE